MDERRIDSELLHANRVGFRLMAGEPGRSFDLGDRLTEKERTEIVRELDQLVAHVWLKRMLESCGWSADELTPPWAITTTLVLERMLQPFHTPLELWNCIEHTNSQGVRLWHEPGFAYHDDVRDG